MWILVLKTEFKVVILRSTLSFDWTFWVCDILTASDPASVIIEIWLKGKERNKHSFLKERMRFGEIDDVEFIDSILWKTYSKVEPLSSSFGIDIVLKDQVILIGWSLSIEK